MKIFYLKYVYDIYRRCVFCIVIYDYVIHARQKVHNLIMSSVRHIAILFKW